MVTVRYYSQEVTMKVIGIIAEYNPFHNGHRYHIEQAKRQTNADYVVVIMSGNFVQRGTPAVIDKYSRTKMALKNGADLVFELPVVYATASAEAFAFGSVSLLHNLGFIDSICFGCETPDLSLFKQIADLFLQEPDDYKDFLHAYQKQGLSFPVARSKAALSYFASNYKTSSNAIEELLSNPNNILAIEYIKALKQLDSPINPVAILRKNAGYHDIELSGEICSATAIRTAYAEKKNISVLQTFLPKSCYDILDNAKNQTFPIVADDFSSFLYYKLLQTTDFTAYTDISNDFANRLKKIKNYEYSFTDYVDTLKTKDLVYTRICRNLTHILLDLKNIDYKTEPSYLRLLGFKKSASFLLKKGKNSDFSPSIPVITKTADAKSVLSASAYAQFEKDVMTTHLYNHVCFQKYGSVIKNEFTHGPVII